MMSGTLFDAPSDEDSQRMSGAWFNAPSDGGDQMMSGALFDAPSVGGSQRMPETLLDASPDGDGSRLARLLFAAPASGSGKTMVTCGMLRLFTRKGIRVAALKCGPDYIDPMFHRQVLGIPTGNLDTWLMDRDRLPELISSRAKTAELAVIEGVMGYYDGLGGVSHKASTWDVADATKTPVILVVDAKGSGNIPETREALAAEIRKLTAVRRDHGIAGILFNRASGDLYELLKRETEETCGLPVFGYLPELPALSLPSRHLGLIAPEELRDFRSWADAVADQMEQTTDWKGMLETAKRAGRMNGTGGKRNEDGLSDESSEMCLEREENRFEKGGSAYSLPGQLHQPVRLAVARDEAFSFYYAENQELLEQMGARLQFFSPLHDRELPADVDGLILWGGYPERYAEGLERNRSMRRSIFQACRGGMPCVAECGGFLYLQEELEGTDGKLYSMTGVLSGCGIRKEKLVRFGYMEAESLGAGLAGGKGTVLRGHEFHYWDCTLPGEDFLAAKPTRKISYTCMVHTPSMLAGFPHFYYPGNPDAAWHFLEQCLRYRCGRLAKTRWDSIAKPIDSLGLLEDHIVKISRIRRSAALHGLEKKGLLIYCADHGVVEEGVTQTGQEVTRIVSENFAKGCSTVNYLAEKAGADVYVTDVGMRTPHYPEKGLVTGAVIDRKVAMGTANLADAPAMTVEQCRRALDTGRQQVRELAGRGYGILAAGEMGIGNTTPASALASVFLDLDPESVTGRGAGLSEEGLKRKREVVRRAAERVRQKGLQEPLEILAEVGGLEIAAMAGACLGAMDSGIPLVIDGAICAVAALAAARMDCRVTEYLLASHVSQEPVGGLALDALGLEAILHGRMCLGEGTGAVMLFPLLDMAEAVYRGMGSFEEYEIAAYERYR